LPPSISRLSNQAYGPPWPVTEISLPFYQRTPMTPCANVSPADRLYPLYSCGGKFAYHQATLNSAATSEEHGRSGIGTISLQALQKLWFQDLVPPLLITSRKPRCFPYQPYNTPSSSSDELAPLTCFHFRINPKNVNLTESLWDSLDGGSALSQGHYLHRIKRTQKNRSQRHPCLKWFWNPRSHCSSVRSNFVP
jgi:hypothetical protein